MFRASISNTRQTFENWARILDAYWVEGVIDVAPILVAHSSASPFIVRYIASRGAKAELLATVAGFTDFVSGDKGFDLINSALYPKTEAFEAVASAVKRRVCFFSQDDPFLPLSVLREFAEKLSAETKVFEHARHFNATSGFTTFNDLVDVIFDCQSS